MPVAGIFWGSLVAVAVVALTVVGKGRNGGRDSSGWAWIDVVSVQRGIWVAFLKKISDMGLDLHHRLREACGHGREVHPASLGELQATVYSGLEHQSDLAGHQWGCALFIAAHYRFEPAGRLERSCRQPGEARTWEHQHCV